MKKLALSYFFGLFVIAAFADEDAPKVEYKPLAIGALHEFGQLGRGVYQIGDEAKVLTNDWMDHFGAFVTKEAIVDDRLYLSGGLGGVFEFRKPERGSPGFFGSQRKGFFIGPTKAVAEYHFGEPTKPFLTVGTGMFMYKYNSDASDLGEYLFRSGPYPVITSTGGYVLVNSAAVNLQGLKSSLDLGAFKADVMLTTETGLAPLYDWSLSGVVSYSIGDGLLDLGAGVNFKRLIQVKPSRTSPPNLKNGYFKLGGKDYSTNTDYYSNQREFYYRKKNHLDTLKADALKIDQDLVQSVRDSLAIPTATHPEINYFTHSGVLLMSRASMDFKKLFSSEVFGPQDLKLYSEVAVLGVKNYPVFYTKISERIPVMVGFNFPGFHFLDLISIQVERFNSPWLNNTSQIANGALPIPFFPKASDTTIASTKKWNDLATKDNYKWSLLIQKKLGNYVTFSAQAASDHMRQVSSIYFYGPQFDHNEITVSKSDWYWMTQISWGI